MVKFALAFHKIDKVNTSLMLYSNYSGNDDFYKGIINEDLLGKLLDYYNLIKALIGNGSSVYKNDFELFDIN